MYNDFLSKLETKMLNSINVCLPGIIESYDFKTQKANIKIDSKRIEDNNELTEYPVISNVPILTLSSGGAFISMPIKVGDSCLVFFADKDISNWLLGASTQVPNTKRMHHLSDAIAIIGLNKFTKPIPIENNSDLNISYANTIIRIKESGDVEIDCKTNVKLNSKTAEINLEEDAVINCRDANLTSSGNVNLKTTKLSLKGDLEIDGNLNLEGQASGKNNQKFKISNSLEVTGEISSTQDIKAGNTSLQNHTHLYLKPVVGSTPTAATPGSTEKPTL